LGLVQGHGPAVQDGDRPAGALTSQNQRRRNRTEPLQRPWQILPVFAPDFDVSGKMNRPVVRSAEAAGLMDTGGAA
jgi:hypothetical protein